MFGITYHLLNKGLILPINIATEAVLSEFPYIVWNGWEKARLVECI